MSAPQKLSNFSQRHRDFVIHAFAKGHRATEIIPVFQRIFPEFGANLDKEVLKKKLLSRITDIKRNHRSEIRKFNAAPELYKNRIRASASFRLSLLLDLYRNTPVIIRVKNYEKCNSIVLMKIIQEIGVEMDILDCFHDGSMEFDEMDYPLDTVGPLNTMGHSMRLSNFSEKHRDFVIQAFARGHRATEIIRLFECVFPEFGAGLAKEVLKKKLLSRITDIKRHHKAEIKQFSKAPEFSEREIVAGATFRLSLLLDLYQNTPILTSGENHGTCNSMELLKIIQKIRVEMGRSDRFQDG